MTKLSTHSILPWLREKWQRTLCNHRSMSELSACPPSELQCIARDVRLGETDLRYLSCSHLGPSALMPRRLEQLGLDIGYVKYARAATYRDLERVCATCKAWRRCARDLANGDIQTGMREYCLNSATIDALTVDWPVPRTKCGDTAATLEL